MVIDMIGKSLRELMEEAYMQGYRDGRNVEEMDGIRLRTGKDQFERWFETNFEE